MKGKKVVSSILVVVILFGIFVFINVFHAFQNMSKKTNEALAKQVNEKIDMNLVKDGTYLGTGDGGQVQVEVKVIVKKHTIASIHLLKHENGLGKDAEVIVEDMIKKNSDNVDMISGATISSKTIRNAVNKALQKGMK